MEINQVVRFIKPSRFGDWKRGELGKITKVLAYKTVNLNDLYVIEKDNGGSVWATNEDVQAFDQLCLW